MDECIFCKIAKEEIESKKICESENFFSVFDINPLVDGHALVISKKHFETFLDLFDWFFKSTDSFEEAVNLIDTKMKRNWEKKLIPEAKEIIEKKYNAVMLIIKSMKEYF